MLPFDLAPSTQARPYIYYRVHQDTFGWEPRVGENDVAGMTGQSKRVEAIRIRAYLIKIRQADFGVKVFVTGSLVNAGLPVFYARSVYTGIVTLKEQLTAAGKCNLCKPAC